MTVGCAFGDCVRSVHRGGNGCYLCDDVGRRKTARGVTTKGFSSSSPVLSMRPKTSTDVRFSETLFSDVDDATYRV